MYNYRKVEKNVNMNKVKFDRAVNTSPNPQNSYWFSKKKKKGLF